MHRRALLATPLLLATPALGQGAGSGEWPNRPVKVIVPWPPGGSTDVLARLMSEQLTQRLGQQYVLENRPGAGGNIGMEALAKSTPDGYTQGPATIANLSIAQFLYSRLGFDPEKDFDLISLHWELPNVFVAPAQFTPPNTMQEFIAWAKARPRGITYGSPGIGTTAHLSGSLFCNRMGIDGEHVPFRGAAQIIPAMLSGDLTCALDNLASYLPVIAEGRMKAYAVTSPQRWPSLPNVPVMREVGVENFTLTSWCAWAAPRGTPSAVVDKVNAAMKAVSEDPAMQQRFLQAGARCVWSTPERATAWAAEQRLFWREVVRISGAKAD